MNITIIAIGSRGCVQPYVALGVGLEKAGYRVKLATHAIFENLVKSYGLEFAPVGNNPQELLKKIVSQLKNRNKIIPLNISFKIAFWSAFASDLDGLMNDCWECSQDAEAIVYSELALPGYHVAEKLGIPAYAAYTQPLRRTNAFRHTQSNFQLPQSFNKLTHIFEEEFRWQFTRKKINQWRKNMDLSPLPITGSFYQQQQQQVPFFYCYSPSVIPKPDDWSEWTHVTGYWFLDSPSSWQPPKELVDFLESGEPPVYIGFGSMRSADPEALTKLILAALERTGRRGIILTGWGALSNTDLPKNVFQVSSIPHNWLFPKMAAVVHHGGSGTTSAGLRAGVPSIIVPFGADQPFWGQVVAAKGIGPTAIPQKQLTVDKLAAAIETALDDEEMKKRAAALGEKIRAEDGVKTAIEVINNHQLNRGN
ncbi:MAG: glycosyltransferase [Cyanobacteria bacterium J06629_18]